MNIFSAYPAVASGLVCEQHNKH